MIVNRIIYGACTAIAALLLLAGTSLAVGKIRQASTSVADADTRLTRDYLAYNRRAGLLVFRAGRMVPGEGGRRLLVIGNDGTRYVRRITLTQDQVTNTGLGRALRLQLYDRTTNRCIYPAPQAAEPSRGSCRHWGEWDAQSELRGRVIAPRAHPLWRPGERHVIVVRYELMPWSSNDDQGQNASFRFVWRYHG